MKVRAAVDDFGKFTAKPGVHKVKVKLIRVRSEIWINTDNCL